MQRLGSVAAALFGVAGVVTLFVGILSIAAGFRHVMASAGAADTAIVLRSGADSEMVSGFGRFKDALTSDPAARQPIAAALREL